MTTLELLGQKFAELFPITVATRFNEVLARTDFSALQQDKSLFFSGGAFGRDLRGGFADQVGAADGRTTATLSVAEQTSLTKIR